MAQAVEHLTEEVKALRQESHDDARSLREQVSTLQDRLLQLAGGLIFALIAAVVALIVALV